MKYLITNIVIRAFHKTYLIVVALGCLFGSFTRKLPGRKFDYFGRRLGVRILLKRKSLDHLLLNPVSSVRYFEFDFVLRHLPRRYGLKILDISSPYLFGLYLEEQSDVDYLYINQDAREFKRIKFLAQFIKCRRKHYMLIENATNLSHENSTFDCIVSISVIEHISGKGDSEAISEMWRVLKPGGKLILTCPVMRTYKEEYRNNNAYGSPDVEQKDNQYFFQRFYDKTTITNRLLDHLPDCQIESTEIFGEICKDFFANYEKRWILNGLNETVKDPWYMATKMQSYSDICELPGLGVMGLSLRKNV